MREQVQIPDASARQQALDPEQSFIVQAPAGSGKTGLLIQRYLKLLACVDSPEEVVAITFTRKAAAEMRERVLLALETDKSPVASGNSYEMLTHELAQAVLQRDEKFAWHIVDNPLRLRIQTIDSLCASFTRQMPMLSKFGAQPESTEDAAEFYLEAARKTIEMMEGKDCIADDLVRLLEHLDNDVLRIEFLMAEMLASRDHWLRHIHGKTRDELETALHNVQREALEHVANLFPHSLQGELQALLRYAGANLAADGSHSPIVACGEVDAILASRDMDHWRGVSELLQNKDAWRRQLTVRNGFPAGKTKIEKAHAKAWKERAMALIESLRESDALCQSLIDVRSLPPAVYTDEQWEILGVITRLLPYAVGQLKVVFQMVGKVDFTEVAQRALQALGDPEMPTDLALALDYRIQHLLIDEFQDTSISQYQLIEKMTAGWMPGDGRSLFAVGDPMQSIYRFREAEVGLFLRARHEGIGSIVLQPLTLSANFRSQAGIVAWVNATFAQIMPKIEDVATGAVPYAASVATREAIEDAAVKVHAIFNKNYAAEAKQLGEIILQSQREHPLHTIAILVRSRSHLEEIVPQIKELGLAFRAVEIEALRFKPVVQDLMMLTRALIHQADHLAWFSILRAPWGGMTLADLQILAKHLTLDPAHKGVQHGTVFALLNDEQFLPLISADGGNRVMRIRDVIARCIEHRNRSTLRATVEAAWIALGGPGCLQSEEGIENQNAAGLEDAQIYFDYLQNHEVAGSIPMLATFEKGLSKLYASPNPLANDDLQIMTIHKAKGLEFDVVIVPGLGRSSRGNAKKLLRWIERPRTNISTYKAQGNVDLLLAPIQASGTEDDAIYTWLQKFEDYKAAFEAQRMLYVAATRAKYALHLLGSVDLVANEDGEFDYKPPRTKTLLSKLWPVVQKIYADAAQSILSPNKFSSSHIVIIKEENKVVVDQSLYRLKSGWQIPVAPQLVQWCPPQNKASVVQQDIEFLWVGDIARHIGNVVHRWLQRIAEDEVKGWHEAKIKKLHGRFKRALMLSGMSCHDKDIDYAVERVAKALTLTINDTRGRWILGHQQNAQNELHISAVIDEKSVNIVIDRTFCTKDGVRWVIDYKTSSHEGGGMGDFLDREQVRYDAQLNRYAVLMKMKHKEPVRLGLYFPLLGGWREWAFK